MAGGCGDLVIFPAERLDVHPDLIVKKESHCWLNVEFYYSSNSICRRAVPAAGELAVYRILLSNKM